MSGAKRARHSLGGGAAASGGGSSSSSSSAAAGAAARDPRLSAKVNRLDCTSDIGWGRIMGYATAEECVRAYAQLCVAFGPGARVKRSVWFLRKKMVMAYLTPAERVSVFSLVSVAFGRGAAALKRSAKFGKPRTAPPALRSCSPTDRSRWTGWRRRASAFPRSKTSAVNLGMLSATAKASQTPAARRSSPSCARLRL